MVNAISGTLVKILYGWEAAAFKTEATAIDKVLGWGQKPKVRRSNNLGEIEGTGQRNVHKLMQGKFEGSVDLD